MPLLLGFTVAIVLSIILLATGNTVLPPHVWTAIWNMPPGMGALLGSFFGLLGIALAAWFGLRNLIRAQEHQAELTRQAQEHQAELARRAQKQQAEITRKRDDHLLEVKKKSLAAALLAELNAIRRHAEVVTEIIDAVDAGTLVVKRIDDIAVTLGSAFWFDARVPAFDALIADIGSLEPTLASDVVTCYDTIAVVSRHVGMGREGVVDDLKDLLGGIRKGMVTVLTTIGDTVPQLAAVAGIAPPPK